MPDQGTGDCVRDVLTQTTAPLGALGLPDGNPKTLAAVDKPALSLCPEAALVAWAGAMKLGANKYGAWNWRQTGVAASVYADAMARHWAAWKEGEDLDPESRLSHLGHVMACCAILLDAQANGVLIDDRPSVSKSEHEKKLSFYAQADALGILSEAAKASLSARQGS